MFKPSVLAFLSILILAPAWSATANPEGLVAYWPLDEGQGAAVKDRSGNGNDGVIEGGALWTAGTLYRAIEFNGANALVRCPHIPFDNRSFTHVMWINPSLSGDSQSVFSQYQASSANQALHYRLSANGTVRMGFYSNDLDTPAGVIQANTWCHLAFVYDLAGQTRRVYVNGKVVAEGSATYFSGTKGDTLIGTFQRPDRADRVPEWFDGLIDDVQLYDRVLTVAEIQETLLGLTDPALAFAPSPQDACADVAGDVALSWAAGKYAVAHDVYLGTVFDDVNDAGRTDPRGVLISQDQTDAAYVPAAPLEFGVTYYWRIDEVNAAAANPIVKGTVWSFTVEPYAFPIAGVTATASSAQPGMGPENTINGSGLDDLGRHSTEASDMWVSTDNLPAWIQFEFDRVYTLHEMQVWNSNQLIENILGLGARKVTVEHSTDGQTWTVLAGVPEFAQATGMPSYTANTTVAFGDVAAKHVKLTIDAGWSDAMRQTSLSEVRFLYLPVQAYKPEPAVGAADVSFTPELAWRSGRGATSHTLYIDTDENAVTEGTVPGETVAGHSYRPKPLNFATEYFWKVDETGDAGTYAGNVWNFTTAEYATVDDFEGYNDDIDAETTIWQAWIDGVTSKASGSQVGYTNSPFAERTIVHGGRQSMPLTYDNSASPFYSEATRTFDGLQDWTAGGADSLRLYVRGNAENAPQTLYVTLEDSAARTRTIQGTSTNVAVATEWQEWRIALGEFTGVGLTRIKKMTIGVGNRTSPVSGGTGTVYIDDIGFGRAVTE